MSKDYASNSSGAPGQVEQRCESASARKGSAVAWSRYES